VPLYGAVLPDGVSIPDYYYTALVAPSSCLWWAFSCIVLLLSFGHTDHLIFCYQFVSLSLLRTILN